MVGLAPEGNNPSSSNHQQSSDGDLALAERSNSGARQASTSGTSPLFRGERRVEGLGKASDRRKAAKPKRPPLKRAYAEDFNQDEPTTRLDHVIDLASDKENSGSLGTLGHQQAAGRVRVLELRILQDLS